MTFNLFSARKNDILPSELQELAWNEVKFMPLDSSITRSQHYSLYSACYNLSLSQHISSFYQCWGSERFFSDSDSDPVLQTNSDSDLSQN